MIWHDPARFPFVLGFEFRGYTFPTTGRGEMA